MKKKAGKLFSIIASCVLTTAFTCGAYNNINNNIISAEDEVVWESDIYYVIVNELDQDGRHNQWHTTSDIVFGTNGITVKKNGIDSTDDCFFGFDKGVTPAEVYDHKNFDYVVPVSITCDTEPLDATMPVKIGMEGDVNLDHSVDVRDSSAISRDIEYYRANKKTKLSKFGIYLAAPEKELSAYALTTKIAADLANELALKALDRATGEKIEKTDGESKYSVSLSKAYGVPGETVSIQVVVDADDTFDSLDALIEWDDDTLKSAGAVSVNGTLCESYVEDGMISIVDYSSGTVKDGAIANIEFVIPENAKPDSELEIYFSSVEKFAVHENGVVSDQGNVVNVIGTTIKVLEPTTTKPAETTTTPTTTTIETTQTTTTQTDETTETTAAATSPDITTASSTTTTILSTTQTTTTTPVSSETTQTTPPVLVIPVELGDANLDGKVDVRDAAYIARKLAEDDGASIHNIADYNKDGIVNVRDAAAIALYLSIKYDLDL